MSNFSHVTTQKYRRYNVAAIVTTAGSAGRPRDLALLWLPSNDARVGYWGSNPTCSVRTTSRPAVQRDSHDVNFIIALQIHDEYPTHPRPVRPRKNAVSHRVDSRSKPSPACRGVVYAGANWSQLLLRQRKQNHIKRTKNSARRMCFIKGNDNKVYFIQDYVVLCPIFSTEHRLLAHERCIQLKIK